MRFEDKNQTLVPPKGYDFRKAETDGAYLGLTYFQTVYEEGTLRPIGENIVVIYLNDMGREVGRSVASYRWPEHRITIIPQPVGRWFRFKNGFLLALQGIQEMFKCLNS